MKIHQRAVLLASAILTTALAVPAFCQETAVVLGEEELTQGIPGSGPLTNEQIQAWLDDESNHTTLTVSLPLGLSLGQTQIKGLEQNPLTRAKIELGRQLYFDSRLCSDKIVPLKVTTQDKIDLVEFMRACTGPFPHVVSGRLPTNRRQSQRTACQQPGASISSPVRIFRPVLRAERGLQAGIASATLCKVLISKDLRDSSAAGARRGPSLHCSSKSSVRRV